VRGVQKQPKIDRGGFHRAASQGARRDGDVLGAAQLTVPVQRLIRHDLVWPPTELADPDVAEVEYQAFGPPARRCSVIVQKTAANPW
jgi:hypothetical protein